MLQDQLSTNFILLTSTALTYVVGGPMLRPVVSSPQLQTLYLEQGLHVFSLYKACKLCRLFAHGIIESSKRRMEACDLHV